MTKICTICLKILYLDAFSKQSGGVFGKRSQCKKCSAIKNKEWYRKDPERNKLKAKEAWSKSSIKYKEQLKSRYRLAKQNNKCRLCLWKDCLKDSSRCLSCYVKESIMSISRRHELNKKTKDVAYLINALMHVPQFCPYTGAPLKVGSNTHLDHKVPASKNQELLLTPSNLQWVSDVYNRAKGSMTDEEFKRHWHLTYIP